MTFLDLAALTTLIGAAWCNLLMTRPVDVDSEYVQVSRDRWGRLFISCLTALLISSFYGLLERSLEMSGAGIASVLPVLPTVIFKSHYGSMWLLRLAGLSSAWVVWWAGRRRIGSRLFAFLLLCAASLIVFSRSASGHPSDFGDLSPQQLADCLHLIAVSFWGGSLVAIAFIYPPSPAAENSLQKPVVEGIADRFYVFFGPVLAVLVMTGLYNAWFTIGSFEALATTAYGKLFSVKVMLLLMLAFRYIAPPEHGRDKDQFGIKFLRRTRFEAIVVFVILLCVSLLVHRIPGRHALHLEHLRTQRTVYGPEPVVTLETRPVKITAGIPVAMTVGIREPDGTPFKGLAVSHERILHAVIVGKDLNFFAHIHPEDIGPVTGNMLKEARIPLLFTFPKAGQYLIGIDFSTDDAFYSKTFSVTAERDPGMGEPAVDFSTKKNFGAYQVTLTITPKNVRAGEDTTFRYVIEKDGKAVTDLEPYLGATMHLAVVPSDLTLFIHTHGSVPGESHNHHDHIHAPPPPQRFGPEIESDIVFPVKGIYKIFSQVQHQGKVLLFDFMVNVQ